MPTFSFVTRKYYMHTIIINDAISLSGLQSLKYPPIVNDSNTTQDRRNDVLFEDATIKGMEEYFHIQNRDILLKYLKDTLLVNDRYKQYV
jgi:hypothetical protein